MASSPALVLAAVVPLLVCAPTCIMGQLVEPACNATCVEKLTTCFATCDVDRRDVPPTTIKACNKRRTACNDSCNSNSKSCLDGCPRLADKVDTLCEFQCKTRGKVRHTQCVMSRQNCPRDLCREDSNLST